MENIDKMQDESTLLATDIIRLLQRHNPEQSVADIALTKVLAAMYSTLPEDVAERLIKLHAENLRCSVLEIRMTQRDKQN